MATWFAQNNSVNIDSVNQWNSAADGSGSWLTWASLGATDILVANGKTAIAVNVDFTCATLHNGTTYGGTSGGGFTVATARTITANLVAGSATLLASSGTNTLSIAGDITGGSGGSGAYYQTSSMTCNITGNVTGGSSAHGVQVTAGTINVTGNITGGSGNQQSGIRQSSAAVTVNGNVTGGSSNGVGIYSTGSNTTTVNGNISGATGSVANYALYSQGSNPVTVNAGNVVNTVDGVACAGRLKWNPGAANYVEIPTTASTQKYYFLRRLLQGMRGGFNG